MRIAGAPVAKTESPTRIEFQIRFSTRQKERRRAQEAPAPSLQAVQQPPAPAAAEPVGNIPKLTRLLVLGHHLERLVREGAVKDYAEVSRLTGLTRARVTQIVNLTLLAPEIQEAILNMSSTLRGRDAVTEHDLRQHVTQVEWERQRQGLGAGQAIHHCF